VVLQAVLCLLSMLCFRALTIPVIQRLDAEVKAARGLLMLLPTDVVQGVVALRTGLRDFVRSVT
jgi:hypothetical protein